MPDIQSEKERLYESSSLRDDLPDEPARVLLEWGEGQVDRLAQDYPDEFEQKARFLRQVIKNINRFVGQREYNDAAGQADYMNKVVMYLPELGWEHISQDELMAQLPDDTTDFMANLKAILNTLTPPNVISESGDMLTAGGGDVASFGGADTPTSQDDSDADNAIEVEIEQTDDTPQIDNPSVDGIGAALGIFVGNIVNKAVESMENAQQDAEPILLENTNDDSINQPNDTQPDQSSDDEGLTFDG